MTTPRRSGHAAGEKPAPVTHDANPETPATASPTDPLPAGARARLPDIKTVLRTSREEAAAIKQRIPVTIARLLIRFLDKLHAIGAADERAIRLACYNFVRQLKALDLATSTIRRSLNDVRDVVRAELGSDHVAVRHLYVFKADQRAIDEQTRATIGDRLQHLQPIDPDQIVDAATELLRSASFNQLAAGVVLATGRRLPEVFKGTFTAVGDNYLDFAGAVMGLRREMTIPALVDTATVLLAIRTLRATKDLSSAELKSINGTYATPVKNALRAALPPELATLTLEDARALYATVAYDRHAPPHASMVEYFSEVLGHEPDNAVTVLGKFKYYAAGDELETAERMERARLEMIARLRHRQQNPDLSPTVRDSIATQLDELRDASFRPASTGQKKSGFAKSADDVAPSDVVRDR